MKTAVMYWIGCIAWLFGGAEWLKLWHGALGFFALGVGVVYALLAVLTSTFIALYPPEFDEDDSDHNPTL